MFHDSTWPSRTRAVRRRHLTAPLGFLLVCALLATLPAAAFASAPEMRGEWEVVMAYGSFTIKGKPFISQEAEVDGHFESQPVQFEEGIEGTFTGTLKGSEAEVTIPLSKTPLGNGGFESKTVAVDYNATANTLVLSGSGLFKLGGEEATGTLTATRLRSQKQIEEQEAREKLEKEEHEARANVRGEWSLTLEDGPVVVKELALIGDEANVKNEFAAKSVLLEGMPAGTFAGTLKGAEAEIVLTTDEVPGKLPPGMFTSKTIALSSKTNPTSMTGSGELSFEGGEPPTSIATLTATRIKTYKQIQEQEAKEREIEEREASEQEEREKQAEEAQIAKEKAELLARETTERETRERREREAREAVEKVDKAIVPPPVVEAPKPSLVSVAVAAKTLKGVTVNHSRTVALELSNPNHLAVAGQLDMFTAVSSGSASTKKKITQLGTVSFTVASGGATSVKLKLSSANYATLLKRKRLRVVVNVTTTADGVSTPTKSYGVTLSLAPTTVHKR
jgi:hypothetical protein